MTTYTKDINWRVVVDVVKPCLILGDEIAGWKRMAKEVSESITRHVDDIERVEIECDRVCIFCESDWEIQPDDSESDISGAPLCCDKAKELWRANQ